MNKLTDEQYALSEAVTKFNKYQGDLGPEIAPYERALFLAGLQYGNAERDRLREALRGWVIHAGQFNAECSLCGGHWSRFDPTNERHFDDACLAAPLLETGQ